MSKLKVSHVAPRYERGTTYIGEDGSVTHFHPHSQVILHDYATEDWVLDQITGDIELGDYLTKEDAEAIYSQISYGQYEPLNSHVDDLWYDTTVDRLKMCTEVTVNDEGVITSQVWADVSGSNGEELSIDTITVGAIDLTNGGRHINALAGDSGHLKYDDELKVKWANQVDIYCNTNLQGNKLQSVADPESTYDGVNKRYVDKGFQKLEDKGAPDGYVPLGPQGKISSQFFNTSGFDIIGVYGENNPLPDPSSVADGSAFLCNSDGYTDQYLPGVTSGSGDTCLHVGDVYEHIPSTGTVNADQVIETQNRVFVHPGDIEDLESTFGEYLPLSGGSSSKMTGDIYMQSHRITGLTSEREHATDAVSYATADATYLRQDGNSEMDGDLDMDDHDIKSANSLDVSTITLGDKRHINSLTGAAGKLQYGGADRFHFGSSNQSYVNLIMDGNDIQNVNRIELSGPSEGSEDSRILDVKTGQKGKLGYAGSEKFAWGNSTNWSYNDISMELNSITNLAAPTKDHHAANKAYVDSVGSAKTIGRMFRSTLQGKTSTQYQVGDFFLTDNGNVNYTLVLADARYICFAVKDNDGMTWRPAKPGNVTMPSCNIYLLFEGRTMGYFFTSGQGTFTEGNASGSIVMPVSGFNSTTSQLNITGERDYNLHCEWF